MYVLPPFRPVYHMRAWRPGEARRGLDCLELELQRVMSHHMTAEPSFQVLTWFSCPLSAAIQQEYDKLYK